jgi:hypothetical protein
VAQAAQVISNTGKLSLLYWIDFFELDFKLIAVIVNLYNITVPKPLKFYTFTALVYMISAMR